MTWHVHLIEAAEKELAFAASGLEARFLRVPNCWKHSAAKGRLPHFARWQANCGKCA